MRIPSIPNRTQIPFHAEHSKASGSQKSPPARRAGRHVESVLAAPCRGSFLSVQAIILLSAEIATSLNILLTSTGNLEDNAHKHLIKALRDHHNLVETLNFDQVISYLNSTTPANGPLSMRLSAKLIQTRKASPPIRCLERSALLRHFVIFQRLAQCEMGESGGRFRSSSSLRIPGQVNSDSGAM